MNIFNPQADPNYRESYPSYTLDRDLAEWRRETSPERRAQLNAEWEEGERLAREDELERIRVRYGRGSPEFRRAAMRGAA